MERIMESKDLQRTISQSEIIARLKVSDGEIKTVAKTIDEKSINSLGNLQSAQMFKLSDNILSKTKAVSLPMTKEIPKLIGKIKSSSINGGNVPIVSRIVNSVTSVTRRMNSTLKEIDFVIKVMEEEKIKQREDLELLVEYSNALNEWIREIFVSIKAIEYKLDNFDSNDSTEEREYVKKLEVKLYDLKIILFSMLQMIPQIEILSNNSESLINKMEHIETLTIPLWKQSISTYIIAKKQEYCAGIQSSIKSMTNSLMKENSKCIKNLSLKIAQENLESTISVDTIKSVITDLEDLNSGLIKLEQNFQEKRKSLANDLQTLMAISES